MMYYVSQARRDTRRMFSNEPREWIVRDIEISSEFICCSGPIYSSTSVIRELSSLERRKSQRQRTVRASINISSSYVLYHSLLPVSVFRSLIERNDMKFAIFNDSSSAIRPSPVSLSVILTHFTQLSALA